MTSLSRASLYLQKEALRQEEQDPRQGRGPPSCVPLARSRAEKVRPRHGPALVPQRSQGARRGLEWPTFWAGLPRLQPAFSAFPDALCTQYPCLCVQ